MRVALYQRVSSPKQLGNDSLRTQLKEMRRWAEREDCEVVRVFEEGGKSGSTTNRPALQQMLGWLSKRPGRVDAVLVYDYSRAAKSLEGHVEIRAVLRAQKVRLISVTQPVTGDPYGDFMELIHAGMAELDNSVRGQRSKQGMADATERGRWCWQAPVGYVNCGRRAVPSMVPDPDRAALVSESFIRVARGEAPLFVYQELVARGFSTRRGKTIARQTFYSMLGNPVYKGLLDTKLGVSDGDWKPLVEPETWDRVQALVSRGELRSAVAETRQRAGRRAYRRLREGFELRGWLRCADCGRKLTGGMTKGHAYMNCPDGHVRTRAEALNERFRLWLESVRPNEVFLQRLERSIRAELSAQERELGKRRMEQQAAARRVERKLERLNDALADGAMAADAYGQTYQRLKAELQVLEHRRVEDDLEQLDVDATLLFARKLLSRPGRLWADAAPKDKIQLQRSLFPGGLQVNPALEFSTDPSRHHSMTYLLFGGGAKGMASPTGPNRLQTAIDRWFPADQPRRAA